MAKRRRDEIAFLKRKATQIRKDVLKMLAKAGSGHTGGSLSCVEILVTLYYKVLRHNPKNPKWRERDRFILSKGHAAPTLYAILADMSYFPRRLLWTLRRLGSPLQGHPSSRMLPGIEVSTGSLGQGLSISNGMALAARVDKLPYRVYCLLGDGELDEGETWEAALTSSHYHLSNLTAIIDHNRIQLDGFTSDIKNTEPIGDKFKAFGFRVMEVDGHNFEELLDAFEIAKFEKEAPTMIIAHTVKGKGVSFMENKIEYHGIAPTEEELKWILAELR